MPVESETGAVPAHDGLRLDDYQDIGPAWPAAAEGGPEESEPIQNRPRTFALEHGDLLAEGRHLESGVAPPGKENAQSARTARMIR
jgi:hypothetical protein